MPEVKIKKRSGKEPELKPNTLCSFCFRPIASGEPYIWSRNKNGSTAFMHLSCCKKTGGDEQ